MARTKRTHRRRSAEQWRELLAEQQDSGLSQRAFCAHKGLVLSSFRNWKRRLADTAAATKAGEAEWLHLPVGLAQPCAAGGHWDIELDLGNGLSLRLRQR